MGILCWDTLLLCVFAELSLLYLDADGFYKLWLVWLKYMLDSCGETTFLDAFTIVDDGEWSANVIFLDSV